MSKSIFESQDTNLSETTPQEKKKNTRAQKPDDTYGECWPIAAPRFALRLTRPIGARTQVGAATISTLIFTEITARAQGRTNA
jgi:hypothetical protein